MKIIRYLLIFLCFFPSTVFAQQLPKGWHLLPPKQSGYYGISLEAAYQLLAEKKLRPAPVVVAVLDDGIDTSHEDLKSVLWINEKEIAGNGLDDDGNGYKDDLHGWNFLGGADGRNVLSNSSEWIRVYWRYKTLYEGVSIDTSRMNPTQLYNYALWTKARSGVVGKGMKEEELDNLRTYIANAQFSDSLLQQRFVANEYTVARLNTFKANGPLEKEVKAFFLEVFKQFNDPAVTNQFVIKELQQYVLGEIRRASGDKIPPEDNRATITGDDATDTATRYYGNPDVSNSPLMHGTHLAGIIAADRNNQKGMKGIADKVKIMMVRTSADGDEHDKDIAMGIRYAVDNGARIINMSFGKSLSPDKWMIDDAVRYALSKDVLLVQAAGNSKRNIDGPDNFPNPYFLTGDSIAPNWITVGASDSLGRPAAFSNYGAKVVNVFAPGVAIYSTIPGGDKYMSWDGTSMAAPVVSGIAALLRSYFPSLKAPEIKRLLEQSVVKPVALAEKGDAATKSLDQLCTSGGIVNALQAVQLAIESVK